jgi:CDP-diacylglycerol---glycerol-3-phosphate 3-phosphatidyltransferase
MFDGHWREAVDRTTKPVGQALQRRGVTADVLTATGLISATAAAVAIGAGYFYLAIGLIVLTGLHDLLDGPVAKAAGSSSVRGAFFDSVTDRVTDAILMGGACWYLISANKGHLAVLPLAILGVTALISYQRAKAESLGLSAKGGLMERAERMVLLSIGLLATWLFVPVLWIMLVLTSMTAIGRFVKVWKQAEGPPTKAELQAGAAPEITATSTPPLAEGVDAVRSNGQHRTYRRGSAADKVGWRPGRVESRWRAWREGTAPGASTTQAGEPVGRWRQRRQESMTSRSGRVRRARRTTHAGSSGPNRRGSGDRRA